MNSIEDYLKYKSHLVGNKELESAAHHNHWIMGVIFIPFNILREDQVFCHGWLEFRTNDVTDA